VYEVKSALDSSGKKRDVYARLLNRQQYRAKVSFAEVTGVRLAKDGPQYTSHTTGL
jgi:hypothetical protein